MVKLLAVHADEEIMWLDCQGCKTGDDEISWAKMGYHSVDQKPIATLGYADYYLILLVSSREFKRNFESGIWSGRSYQGLLIPRGSSDVHDLQWRFQTLFNICWGPESFESISGYWTLFFLCTQCLVPFPGVDRCRVLDFFPFAVQLCGNVGPNTTQAWTHQTDRCHICLVNQRFFVLLRQTINI